MDCNKYCLSRVISLPMQRLALLRIFPDSKCEIYGNKGCLEWKGVLKPSPISREYKIRIIYKFRTRPKVILYGETVKDIEKADFPHHFYIDKKNNAVELCLHLNNQYDDTQYIARTIVPWTIEWLFYYEIWLGIGEWCGGGHSLSRKEGRFYELYNHSNILSQYKSIKQNKATIL